MSSCPICGLGERCRNHWIATEEAAGEIAFQTGVMTASEDNLVLLRNKLKNPPLRQLLERIAVAPVWVETGTRRSAYLPWPLDLRAAVHRALFPAGAPAGAENDPLPMFSHTIEELDLERVAIDLENCLPDELLYRAAFRLRLARVGDVHFDYVGLLWAEGMEWARWLGRPAVAAQAAQLLRLMLHPVVDALRARFSGQAVRIVAEEAAQGIVAGMRVDEIVLATGGEAASAGAELHFGEEVEAEIHARRLPPMLRDCLLGLAPPHAAVQ